MDYHHKLNTKKPPFFFKKGGLHILRCDQVQLELDAHTSHQLTYVAIDCNSINCVV